MHIDNHKGQMRFRTIATISFAVMLCMKPGKCFFNSGHISRYIACMIPYAFFVGFMIALGRDF